jgi:hypothetical protein
MAMNSINVTAIDYTASGFNVVLTAMNDLTGGHAVEYVVQVYSTNVNPAGCGFKARLINHLVAGGELDQHIVNFDVDAPKIAS